MSTAFPNAQIDKEFKNHSFLWRRRIFLPPLIPSRIAVLHSELAILLLCKISCKAPSRYIKKLFSYLSSLVFLFQSLTVQMLCSSAFFRAIQIGTSHFIPFKTLNILAVVAHAFLACSTSQIRSLAQWHHAEATVVA